MESLNLETRIKLNKFTPRPYQSLILDSWLNKGFKKILYVIPRRAGKDYLAFYMAILQCIKKPCLVLYALPTYSQAKRCVFQAIDIDGRAFIDMIPSELVAKVNQSEMTIHFVNGSIMRFIGADSYNTSLVGSNAQAIFLSEAGLMNLEAVYAYCRPILAANGGTVVIFGTPRGKNSFWHLYETAKTLPDWFVLKMGVDETKHISDEVLAQEQAQMSENLYKQEYFCSFDIGQDGSIFSREMDKAKLEERIGFFPHQPHLLTHLAIDIGINDATTILWFQIPNEGHGPIFIIDSYSNNNLGLDHYALIIKQKEYNYGHYYAPHDISVRSWSDNAITRYERAHQMGIPFEILKQVDVADSIDNCKLLFPRIHIHEPKCKTFIRALEGYRRVYDEERQIYSQKPLHSWESDFCDSFRYMCQSVGKTAPEMTSRDFDRIRAQALYGGNQLPYPFNNDPRYDKPGRF